MAVLHLTSPITSHVSGIAADATEDFELKIDVLGSKILRIALVPSQGLDTDRTWMIAPEGDVPWEGRAKLSKEGFETSAIQETDTGFESENFRVEVDSHPLRIVVWQKISNRWELIFEDRTGSAYHWFEKSGVLKQFQHLQADEAHYGLGDKAGPLDRTGKRVRCLQSDALGYNAETSDPLYKHAPWLILSKQSGCAGLLYDTMAETTFDLGAEHSNYFKRYRHVEFSEKGMVLYVLAGPTIRDVVPRLHEVTGRIAMPPRWSLGFAFTTMHHADHPQGQRVIGDFAQEARSRKLPISAIHFGSGYTAGKDGLRYVFNWNTERFPNRKQLFGELKALGFRTCANIKPVLLTGHKSFQQASQEGWFVRRGDNSAAIEMFWGGEGASLDFTNPRAIAWWQESVTSHVLGEGFDAVWNDNNEAELWDETALIDGFGKALKGMENRPLHALLMTRASYEAAKQQNLDERPYTISRAGPIGIGRYGETWSGDNRTSWHTLKWNLRQGLSMSLSGMPLVGHDIGGFDGPPPEPELLVRWFQMMALHPRCVMNSWKVDYNNIPNLPWMHEGVFDHIKAALELRYRFLPLIYSLVHTAHKTGHPVIAPTFYHYDDLKCAEECDSFLLGSNVLVAPVVKEGAQNHSVYLPETDGGWFDFHTHDYVGNGEFFTQNTSLGQLPIFIRSGTVLPLANNWDDKSPHDASLIECVAFAGEGEGRVTDSLYWDDGLSWDGLKDGSCLFPIAMEWNSDRVVCHVPNINTALGNFHVSAVLRTGDGRNFEMINDQEGLSK
jgi:alpha-glucosidase